MPGGRVVMWSMRAHRGRIARGALAGRLHGASGAPRRMDGSTAVVMAPHAVLPAPDLRPFMRPGATIAPEALQPLVDHLQLLAFDAYDMEAYLYWSPAHSVVDLSLPAQPTP